MKKLWYQISDPFVVIFQKSISEGCLCSRRTFGCPLSGNTKGGSITVPLTSCVNFTNILWAAFAPKSFWQTITNSNCKHLKTVQRTLVSLSISPIFYQQLFHTKVLCTPFMCLQVGFVIFWQKYFGAKAAHKMLVKLTPVWLAWNQLSDNWQFLFLLAKQTDPNQSNRRSMVQWYFPL